MQQSYSNPPSRNPSRAAGGTIPSQVSVPLPGTNANQSKETGGMAKAPAGFNNGLINGKI